MTDTTSTAKGDRDPAPAVSRALRILSLLAEAEGVPMTLSDIARALGIAKSSTANLCAALEDGAVIEREAGGYRLGRRTAELGGAYAQQFNQVREFYRVVAASPELHREVVQIAMLDGEDALYLARHEGRSPYRLGTPLGSRLPAALSATGVALLARMDDDAVRSLLQDAAPFPRLTPESITTVDELLLQLAEARERGYAVDRGGSFGGIVGVAVALDPWAPADPPLALGAALPAEHVDDARIVEVAAGLQAVVLALTNPLGGRSG
ncbi:IclR family transcriptional regulator [Agrococcus sp. ARC_14]|uniref:IclR family transcriptional regulator n=1 Tax=Agrococcus sp. ARC_14 TaxID=2919927 RepID=UPI001F059CA7|nr:IclR family transcriptional regulator [Agrococcus sp. ARC_14]MCH1882367.1 IclR family transcriptional regulator [Agrococcus sp. ARC_14]